MAASSATPMLEAKATMAGTPRVSLPGVDTGTPMRDPEAAAGYQQRGVEFDGGGDYDRAIAAYNEAMRLDPGDSGTYCLRANTYYRKGDYELAIADYTTAIRLNPKMTGAYINRGNVYSNIEHDEDKAIADFTEAIRIHPHDPRTYNNRGLSYKNKGDYRKAIEDFNDAVEFDPLFATAYLNRGDSWRAVEEYDKAIADYNEAITLDAEFVPAYDGRGSAREKKGDYRKAVADYKKAVALNSAVSCNALAWLLATCPDATVRNGAKAVEYAKKTCDLTAWKAPESIDTLAAAYAEKGDFEQAVKFQSWYLTMKPDNEEAAARLALYKKHQAYHEAKK